MEKTLSMLPWFISSLVFITIVLVDFAPRSTLENIGEYRQFVKIRDYSISSLTLVSLASFLYFQKNKKYITAQIVAQSHWILMFPCFLIFTNQN